MQLGPELWPWPHEEKEEGQNWELEVIKNGWLWEVQWENFLAWPPGWLAELGIMPPGMQICLLSLSTAPLGKTRWGR